MCIPFVQINYYITSSSISYVLFLDSHQSYNWISLIILLTAFLNTYFLNTWTYTEQIRRLFTYLKKYLNFPLSLGNTDEFGFWSSKACLLHE